MMSQSLDVPQYSSAVKAKKTCRGTTSKLEPNMIRASVNLRASPKTVYGTQSNYTNTSVGIIIMGIQ